MVDDLVQQHGEVEDGEALDERERNPDERIRDGDQSPRRQRQHRELPRRDQQMPSPALGVKGLHLVARQRGAELGPKRRGVLTVMV